MIRWLCRGSPITAHLDVMGLHDCRSGPSRFGPSVIPVRLKHVKDVRYFCYTLCSVTIALAMFKIITKIVIDSSSIHQGTPLVHRPLVLLTYQSLSNSQS